MFETILKTTDVSIIPMPQALICMGTALILGLVISICYMCTQKKGSNTIQLLAEQHHKAFKQTISISIYILKYSAI